jgi:hypothetical protein
MVRRKSLKAQELDIQVAEAVLGVQSGKYKSPYAAAKALGLSPTTVLKRVQGRVSRTQARQQQQILSATQEKSVLKWIKELTVGGYAPSHRLLREIADEIRMNRCRVFEPTQLFEPERISDFPLGQDWVPRFIQRHPHLKVRIGRRIEAQRMDGVTVPVVNAWFDALKDILTRMKIKENNIYNMDETGFSIGTMESTRIIIDSTLHTRYQAHPGRQEWVSIVECICADGTAIEPLVIFKGHNVLQSWIPNSVLNKWYFSANSNGWTSNLHGIEWLKRVFEPATRAKANGGQRLLICDGHDSHICGSFISHCIQNRISLLILPPHTSHVLQPLDVAIFGPLKKKLTAALAHLNEAQLVRIQKVEWLDAYIQAREQAISKTNIESAFRGAGLIPFQPQRVLRIIKSQPTTPPPQPQTSTEYDILDRVFLNSSPPDISTLHQGNQVLETALKAQTVLNTPVTRYVRKLAEETERLNTRDTIRKRETENLRAIIKTRKERKKGKRLALKGQFHISTEELRAAVVAAEKETKEQAGKKGKKKGKNILYEAESEQEIEEDIQEEIDSDIEDCIVVDVE